MAKLQSLAALGGLLEFSSGPSGSLLGFLGPHVGDNRQRKSGFHLTLPLGLRSGKFGTSGGILGALWGPLGGLLDPSEALSGAVGSL